MARRDDYFDVLDRYREGDAGAIIAEFSRASAIAARESQDTARRVAALPQHWSTLVSVRRGSAVSEIPDRLPSRPVFSAGQAEDEIGGATSSIYAAIDRLHRAGVLRPLTGRTRHQIWGATALLDELDDLGVRIGIAARRA